jgi:hypothetical protein
MRVYLHTKFNVQKRPVTCRPCKHKLMTNRDVRASPDKWILELCLQRDRLTRLDLTVSYTVRLIRPRVGHVTLDLKFFETLPLSFLGPSKF